MPHPNLHNYGGEMAFWGGGGANTAMMPFQSVQNVQNENDMLRRGRVQKKITARGWQPVGLPNSWGKIVVTV